MEKKLFVLLVACIYSVRIWAYDLEINGIYYNVNLDSMTAKVTSGDSLYTGDIVIPSVINFKGRAFNVISIEKRAFTQYYFWSGSGYHGTIINSSDLKSITLPESLLEIEDEAFYNCDKLNRVKIGNSVKTIGKRAFYSCSSLTSIEIPNSTIEIGKEAFEFCSLNSVKFGNSLKYIESQAFGYNDFTKINIPNSVLNIGGEAFYKCSSLSSVTLGDSLKWMGTDAFSGCPIKTLTIPKSVTYVGRIKCDSLSSVYFQEGFNGKVSYIGCPLEYIYLAGTIKVENAWMWPVEKIRKYEFAEDFRGIYESSDGEKNENQFQYIDELSVIYSHIKDPIQFIPQFPNKVYVNTILYIPIGTKDLYQQTENWKQFLDIRETDFSKGEGNPRTKEEEKCAIPAITYSNKQLRFESSTANAEYHYTLSTEDAKTEAYSQSGAVTLIAAYKITAYATAEGYKQSDNATATLYWVDGSIETTNINTAKTRGILASSNDGIVTVSGLNNGESIAFYTVDGKMIGKSVSVNGIASYAVGNAKVVIAKVGAQSIKIAVE